jgi:hypothetical protein
LNERLKKEAWIKEKGNKVTVTKPKKKRQYHKNFNLYFFNLLPVRAAQCRVGNKKPAQKTKKKPPKKTTSKRFLGVLLGFFKTDICFWCKSHYFSSKISLVVCSALLFFNK